MAIIYHKCMNRTEHEELGDEPLIFVLSELGGWPVMHGANWNASNFTLDTTLIRLKQMGYKHDLFSSLEVAPHVLAHKFNLIYVSVLQNVTPRTMY